MVRIVNYHQNEGEDGEVWYSLTLQGGVELVLSAETGNYYATARKARITCTFNDETCKNLLGTELPGSIRKVSCDAYDYVVPDTGEVIQLEHTYQYVPDELSSVEAAVMAD